MIRTQSELRFLGMAAAKMLSAYPGLFVGEHTCTAYLGALDDFTATVAGQALELTPFFCRSRPPNAAEVWELADHISRFGYVACHHASRHWRANQPRSSTVPALVGEALRQEIRAAVGVVGNSNAKPAVAQIPEMAATQEPLSEAGERFKQGVTALARRFESEGLDPVEARLRAFAAQASVTSINCKSIPRRKQRLA